MKNTWSDVNQFLSKQKKNSKPLTTLKGPDTGATTTSGPEHAKIRNNNFSSNRDNLANTCNIVPSNNHFSDYESDDRFLICLFVFFSLTQSSNLK